MEGIEPIMLSTEGTGWNKSKQLVKNIVISFACMKIIVVFDLLWKDFSSLMIENEA